jgi:WD40 repeat protein
LVSASEDCTLKVWDVNKFNSLKEIEGVINYEPYLTLRGHETSILTCSGVTTHSNDYFENFIVSGSLDGTIKTWKIPPISKIEPYG